MKNPRVLDHHHDDHFVAEAMVDVEVSQNETIIFYNLFGLLGQGGRTGDHRNNYRGGGGGSGGRGGHQGSRGGGRGGGQQGGQFRQGR